MSEIENIHCNATPIIDLYPLRNLVQTGPLSSENYAV